MPQGKFDGYSLAFGSQLAQSRLGDTTAAAIYTAPRNAELTKIFVCNTTGSAATFRLFHDNDGTTYDQTTALYYDYSVAANTTLIVSSDMMGGGISIFAGGKIAFREGTADALTITLYGVLEQAR